MCLFAGSSLNDLHRLDTSILAWTDLTDSLNGAVFPSPRRGHGFASAMGKLYVFGGTDGGDLA